MEPVTVAVVEDFPLMLEALSRSLDAAAGINVVAHCANGDQAVRAVREVRPQVVLLDLHLPGQDGLQVLRQIRQDAPEVRVLVLTASEKPDALMRAMSEGASGYLTKRTSSDDIVAAVREVARGTTVVEPVLASRMAAEMARGTSSRLAVDDCEREVLRLVAEGCTDREIASRLYISPRTVQNYLTRIRRRTGVQRRPELARWAVEHLAL